MICGLHQILIVITSVVSGESFISMLLIKFNKVGTFDLISYAVRQFEKQSVSHPE